MTLPFVGWILRSCLFEARRGELRRVQRSHVDSSMIVEFLSSIVNAFEMLESFFKLFAERRRLEAFSPKLWDLKTRTISGAVPPSSTTNYIPR